MTLGQQRKHNVLYVHHGKGIEGGAPLSLLYLVERVDRSRFEPTVICVRDSNVVEHFNANGIPTVAVKGIEDFNHTTAGWYPLYSPFGLLRLLRRLVFLLPSALKTKAWIRAHDIDLVHLNSLSLSPSAIGAKLAGVPVVWHIREAVHQGHLGLRKRLIRWAVNTFADEAIYICEDNRTRLGADGRAAVIYNFVDFRRFDPGLSGQTVRQELGLAAADRVVLMLGGIAKIKGSLELVEAMSHVAKRIPNARCIVSGCLPSPGWAGSWPVRLGRTLGFRRYTERVYHLVQKAGLIDHIRFLPFRHDVPQLIAASDVVVFPSTQPHFARPVIEAGAMSKPVVASRIGGVEEVVEDGVTGLLVAPADPAALGDAIVRVLADPDRAEEMGRQGYTTARRRFDADVNARQTVACYDAILAERAGSQVVGVEAP